MSTQYSDNPGLVSRRSPRRQVMCRLLGQWSQYFPIQTDGDTSVLLKLDHYLVPTYSQCPSEILSINSDVGYPVNGPMSTHNEEGPGNHLFPINILVLLYPRPRLRYPSTQRRSKDRSWWRPFEWWTILGLKSLSEGVRTQGGHKESENSPRVSKVFPWKQTSTNGLITTVPPCDLQKNDYSGFKSELQKPNFILQYFKRVST